jgi:hypothetical protein
VRRAVLRRLAWVSLWALAWLPPLKRSLVHQAGSNKRTGLLVHYSPCIRHVQSAPGNHKPPVISARGVINRPRSTAE